MEIKAGIPQGSILGPLFFRILINDIVNSSNKFSFLMYADDNTIYFNLEDFPAIHREHEINKELEKLNIWFQLNKLTLNVDKTKCMLFHKRRAVTPINISNWLSANKLSLNVKKSYYMVFHRAKLKIDKHAAIKMNGVFLQRTNSLKYLGVIIDHKLNWTQHIAHVRNKVSKGIGIMYRARNYLTKNILKS